MTKITDLLDTIDQLDQRATPGPWVIDSIESGEHALFVDESNPEYGRLGAGTCTVASFMLEKNAELIAEYRDTTPKIAAALRAVLELHVPTTRWQTSYDEEHSFYSEQDMYDYYDGEVDWGSITTFQLCALCAKIEEGAAENLGHLTAIWPCPTIETITKALGTDHE